MPDKKKQKKPKQSAQSNWQRAQAAFAAAAARAQPAPVQQAAVAAAPNMSLPGLPSVGGISIGSYTAPYDQAEAAARQFHAQAQPEIQAAYDTLKGQLAGYQTDYAAQAQKYQGEAQGRTAAAQQEVGSANKAIMDQLAAQFGNQLVGSVGGGAAAEAQRQQGELANQGTAQTDLMNRLAQVQQQSSGERTASADVQRSGALSNAAAELQAVLGQIGFGRAEAQRAYEADKASLVNQLFDQQLALSDRAYGRSQDALNQKLARKDEAAALGAERSAASRAARGAALSDINAAAQADPLGALRSLEGMRGALLDGSLYGESVDPAYLERYIRSTYLSDGTPYQRITQTARRKGRQRAAERKRIEGLFG